MNIFTLDNLKRFESHYSVDNTAKPVDIVQNLGSYSLQISPERFYNRNASPSGFVEVFPDLFTLSPRWVFNLWIDNSNVKSGTTYDHGGIWIYYKNGTAPRLIYAPVYDGTSTPEYKHVLFISEASDLVSHIAFRYNYMAPSYYRIDSTITPYTDDIKINKTGMLNTSNLNEELTIRNTLFPYNLSFNQGGAVNATTLIEI